MIDLLFVALFQSVAGAPADPPADPAPYAASEEYDAAAPEAAWGAEGSTAPTETANSRGEPRQLRSCFYERNSGWRFRMQRCEVETVYPGDPGYDEAQPMQAASR